MTTAASICLLWLRDLAKVTELVRSEDLKNPYSTHNKGPLSGGLGFWDTAHGAARREGQLRDRVNLGSSPDSLN